MNANNWLWHIGHVPALPVGPMVLGNMDIGLNTANLAAIVIIVLLTVLNTFGVKLGASVQNVFTSAKVLALAAVCWWECWRGMRRDGGKLRPRLA